MSALGQPAGRPARKEDSLVKESWLWPSLARLEPAGQVREWRQFAVLRFVRHHLSLMSEALASSAN